ncbi:glycine zipper 2TM domain-containing protein [Klebsiella pneumoniae]|uniref:glycine zipper 2TM domain-containing protein n=1 Tax=Klebsiella pneumoniae TaxID=573 RepID=UPI003854ADAB
MGAVLGNKVIDNGILGTAGGAAAGAFAGQALERTLTAKQRCREVETPIRP